MIRQVNVRYASARTVALLNMNIESYSREAGGGCAATKVAAQPLSSSLQVFVCEADDQSAMSQSQKRAASLAGILAFA